MCKCAIVQVCKAAGVLLHGRCRRRYLKEAQLVTQFASRLPVGLHCNVHNSSTKRRSRFTRFALYNQQHHQISSISTSSSALKPPFL